MFIDKAIKKNRKFLIKEIIKQSGWKIYYIYYKTIFGWYRQVTTHYEHTSMNVYSKKFFSFRDACLFIQKCRTINACGDKLKELDEIKSTKFLKIE